MKSLAYMILFLASYMVGVGFKAFDVDRDSRPNIEDEGKEFVRPYQQSELITAMDGVLKDQLKKKLELEVELRSQEEERELSLEEKIDYIAQEEDFADFKQALRDYKSSNDEDKELAIYLERMLIGDQLRGIIFSNEEMDKLSSVYLQKLESKPRQSFNIIKNFIKQIDVQKYPAPCIALMVVSGRMQGIGDDVKEFALELATRTVETGVPDLKDLQTEDDINLYQSTTFEMYVPVVSHQIYLAKEQNETMAIERTIDTISSQRDERIRLLLYENFAEKLPKLKSKLRERLQDRGIKIS